jgi:hypothetical protein
VLIYLTPNKKEASEATKLILKIMKVLTKAIKNLKINVI